MLDLIYRDNYVCLFCKETGEKKLDYLCQDCFQLLNFRSEKFYLENFQYVYAILEYDRLVREHLFPYKYSHKSYYYKVFGDIMVHEILSEGLFKDIDYIVAVPIHRRKRALRGYNQSELLGDYIGEKLGIEVLNDLVYKTETTKDQHNLSGRERRENLKDAFSIRDAARVRDKNILIVDDVFTTGTTMLRLSSLLKEARPASIYGLALAGAK